MLPDIAVHGLGAALEVLLIVQVGDRVCICWGGEGRWGTPVGRMVNHVEGFGNCSMWVRVETG